MLGDATYERVKAMIYGRQLRAGQRIVERKLARELGVSRIPLREGMIRLESEGLVRSIPHSSSYIAEIGAEDLMEIYSMRLWLEPPATRYAASRASADLVKSLSQLSEQMASAVAAEKFSLVDDLDYQFHHAIVIASGHSRLVRAYECSHIRIVGFYTDFLAQKSTDPNRIRNQHVQIIRALKAGDPERAERVARTHVQGSIANFEKKIGLSMKAGRSATKQSSNRSIAPRARSTAK